MTRCASTSIKAQVSRKRTKTHRQEWGVGHLATFEQVGRIKALRAQGMTVRQISEQLGVSKSQVGRLVRERS